MLRLFSVTGPATELQQRAVALPPPAGQTSLQPTAPAARTPCENSALWRRGKLGWFSHRGSSLERVSSCPAQGTEAHCWSPLFCCQSSFYPKRSILVQSSCKSPISGNIGVTGQRFGGKPQQSLYTLPSCVVSACRAGQQSRRPWASTGKRLLADGPIGRDKKKFYNQTLN